MHYYEREKKKPNSNEDKKKTTNLAQMKEHRGVVNVNQNFKLTKKIMTQILRAGLGRADGEFGVG